MPIGVHSGTSQQAIKFTSEAGPELRPRYEKLARLRKTAQFVNQYALRSPKKYRDKAGMLPAILKAEVSPEDSASIEP